MKTKKLAKKADLMHNIIMQLILIALIFGLFLGVATSKVNSNATKQQVLEKQTALFIDSAEPGVSITIAKNNKYGLVNNMKIEQGKVFIYVNGQDYSKGYPYFTSYQVSLDSDANYYHIKIK